MKNKRIVSEETRKKISEGKKLYYLTHSIWNKGKPFSESTRKKMSLNNVGTKGMKLSLETKMKMSLGRRGKDNGNWKGGISSLSNLIRSTQNYDNCRFSVFKRDNFTCQSCGHKQGNIEADHIKPFCIILSEFLNIYSQFSPVEDKETLLRLAETYEPFWDISNGRTLCKPCHKMTDTYGSKARNREGK